MTALTETEPYDAVIIGAGPAGLAAGLALVRARRRVLLVDSNRPRNAATLHAHGFITRDGISPLDLRRIGREEIESYPGGEFHSGLARSVSQVADASGTGESFTGARFMVSTRGLRGEPSRDIPARAVLVATGLSERLPNFPSIRAWYGTNLHSCIECDGYEKTDAALALIGESTDLAERALLLSQWSDDLIVFTNAVGQVSDRDEAGLAARGIRVDRRRIADVVGDHGAMTGVQMEDGDVVPRKAGFVRPQWTPAIDFLDLPGLETDVDELLVVDAGGRSSVPGLYAAGDATPPGPQQLLVAAGSGASAAATLNRDLIGPL